MIPDGCGPATLTLARLAAGRPLTLDSLLVGGVATAPAGSRVTDSAASATAYASGIETTNGVVGLDADGHAVRTLLEAAALRGMATGLVVKSRLTDATPAAFVAHVRSREHEDSIAVQELEHRVDLMFGGGLDEFLPRSAGGARADTLDLIAEARRRGYQVVTELGGFRLLLRLPVLALFAPGSMPYEIDRDSSQAPDLPEMTRSALALLSQRPAGFVLMVEGSRIDHTGHENDPAAHVVEALEYDRAVREAVAFARRDGHTLVVSAADHETGGLSLARRVGETSFYDVHPESLATVGCSARRMADSIRAGRDPVEYVEQRTGLHLTPDEQTLLRTAAGQGAHLTETIGEIESRHALVGWNTWGHTAVDVGLYAFGPGRDRFRGVMRNTQVGRAIAACAGLTVGGRVPATAGGSTDGASGTPR